MDRHSFCGTDSSIRWAVGLKGPHAFLHLWIVCFSDSSVKQCVADMTTYWDTSTVSTWVPKILSLLWTQFCIFQLAVDVIVSQLPVKRSMWKRTDNLGWVSKAMSKEEKAVLVGLPEPRADRSVEQWIDPNVRCFDKKGFTVESFWEFWMK